MSWLISAKQYIPAVIGEEFGGGYFAGYISHTADGSPTHALIVAPAATGASGTGYTLTTNYKWADETVAVPAHSTLIGASSLFDGKANTDLMMSLIANSTYSAGAFPAAQFCADLSIGGFTDWYLPARYELEIAYFNLKPTTTANNTANNSGPFNYAVPQRTTYTSGSPAQTYVSGFIAGSGQAFQTGQNHFESNESNATTVFTLSFNAGSRQGVVKTVTSRAVRAFRRIAL
jgi:hypothetical protein